MASNSQKGAECLGKRRTVIGVPISQRDLSGKDITEHPGEIWVTLRAQTAHEGDKQSVADQAVHKTSSFREDTDCRVPERVSSG